MSKRVTLIMLSKYGNNVKGKNMIGDNVKKFRKKKGLTQDGLARKADIPYTTLTKLESNVVKKPSVQTVAKIARALGISMEELIK
jgi:transcriptional regulator with XRE-family HTH domain